MREERRRALEARAAMHDAAAAQQREAASRQATESVQATWLPIITAAASLQALKATFAAVPAMQAQERALLTAAQKIMRFLRYVLMKRRHLRARERIQKIRSVVGFLALCRSVVYKDRAADVIRSVLAQRQGHVGSDSITRAIRHYRQRVLLVQTYWRSRLSVKAAKVEAWTLQWQRMEKHKGWPPVSPQTRAAILDKHFSVRPANNASCTFDS